MIRNYIFPNFSFDLSSETRFQFYRDTKEILAILWVIDTQKTGMNSSGFKRFLFKDVYSFRQIIYKKSEPLQSPIFEIQNSDYLKMISKNESIPLRHYCISADPERLIEIIASVILIEN